MLKLFAMKNTLFNDDATFERQLALVGDERRKKVNSLALREKKNASLAAGVILPLALKACGISGEIEVERGLWDKPKLTSPQGVFFNLSHSGEWTVIAISDNEVGVDIQQVKPLNMRLATRFFSENEQKILAEAGDDAGQLFYRLWTVKEAYLKAVGTGLSRPLNSFSVRMTAGGAKLADGEVGEGWLVSEFDCFEGYALACVAREFAPPIQPEILEIK